MGVFQDLTLCVNRTPINLNVRFDGQEHTLTPGKNYIPKVTVTYAKNQNTFNGSQDPENPSASGARYLLAFPEFGDQDVEPFTEEEWAEHKSKPSRFDHVELIGQRLGKGEHIEVRGRKTVSRLEASVRSDMEFGGNDA